MNVIIHQFYGTCIPIILVMVEDVLVKLIFPVGIQDLILHGPMIVLGVPRIIPEVWYNGIVL
tara:strand:- start:375 stop:560 length:186 start_codon:yes stop_codon:yes gene_type:complete